MKPGSRTFIERLRGEAPKLAVIDGTEEGRNQSGQPLNLQEAAQKARAIAEARTTEAGRAASKHISPVPPVPPVPPAFEPTALYAEEPTR